MKEEWKEDLKVIGTFERFLFLVFLILKVSNTINWSWWLVCLPLYAIPAVVIIIGFFIIAGLLIGKIFG